MVLQGCFADDLLSTEGTTQYSSDEITCIVLIIHGSAIRPLCG